LSLFDQIVKSQSERGYDDAGLAAGYPFGEYDVPVGYEAPDETAAASSAMAVAAGGAVRSAKTTRLLTGEEWVESLREAQGSQYKPAR
jgi:GYD domain